MDLAYSALTENDLNAAARVEPLEDTIDILTERLKSEHVKRLQSGRCTLELGFVFNDCINNFERVADHCSNIALIVMEMQNTMNVSSHQYVETMKKNRPEQYTAYVQEYEQKYLSRLDAPESEMLQPPAHASI
jgi:phosphate:Na+ symporter